MLSVVLASSVLAVVVVNNSVVAAGVADVAMEVVGGVPVCIDAWEVIIVEDRSYRLLYNTFFVIFMLQHSIIYQS